MKNFNVNLFMCLHLETNSYHVLSSDSGSAFMTTSFSVKHVPRFLVPPVDGWTLKAIYHIIYAVIFQLPDIFREFRNFFTFIFKRSGMVVVKPLKFFRKYHKCFSLVYIWPIDLHSDKHFSASGQLDFCRQLHSFAVEATESFNKLVLRFWTTLAMFCIQL